VNVRQGVAELNLPVPMEIARAGGGGRSTTAMVWRSAHSTPPRASICEAMLGAFHHRTVRFLRVTSRRWQKRLVFFAGGLVVGAAAILLAMADNESQGLFQRFIVGFPDAGFIVTPIGFGLCVYLTRKYFANTQGSRIPQVIAARKLEISDERSRLVGPRIAVGKLLMTLLGLLAGASTGREGPTVQIT
jgi:H+/Cl- antiporter ClcA